MGDAVVDPRPRHYLDHAATSWPKAPGVVEAVTNAFEMLGGNPGRSTYAMGVAAARAVFDTRAGLAALLGVRESRNVILTSSCTEGLNTALLGSLSAGDRVVVSSMEHNSVVRPIDSLARSGVTVVVVEADEEGLVDADAFEVAVAAAPTAAVVCQHASNVSGAIQPIADLADIAHAASARLIVDGAQAAGHLLVDLGVLGADAWAASGHKGLLGPQGTGVLYLAPGFEPSELISGGTGGGESESPRQPKERPGRYEAGTRNTPGLAGLGAAAAYVAEHAEEIRAREARLTHRLHEGLLELPAVRVLGPPPGMPRTPIVSVVIDGQDHARMAQRLDEEFGIAVRAGLHCAPWAHRTLGTLQTGAIRFGVGWSTTGDDISAAIEAMRELLG